MVDMHHHHSVDILTTFPHLFTVGVAPQLDIKDGIPDLLVLAATVVDQRSNTGA